MDIFTFVFKKIYWVGRLVSELNFGVLQRGYHPLENDFLFAKPSSKSRLLPIRPSRAAAVQLHSFACSQRACVRVSLGPARSPQAQLFYFFPSHLGPAGCVPGSPLTLCLPRPDATLLSAGSHGVLGFSLAEWRPCQEITSSWHGRQGSEKHHHRVREKVRQLNPDRLKVSIQWANWLLLRRRVGGRQGRRAASEKRADETDQGENTVWDCDD